MHQGIETPNDMITLLLNIASDALEGKVATARCNAATNALGKTIRMVQLQLKYGNPSQPLLQVSEIPLTDKND